MATKAKTTTYNSMEQIVAEAPEKVVPFHEGEMAEATIVSISKHKATVDLGGLLVGIIPEREFSVDAMDLKPGDKVKAYVLTLENDSGHAILSLRRADKEKLWEELESKISNDDLVTVRITQANRGGLMAAYGNLEGFLPVSQLSSSHYPRVAGADKNKILEKLQQIVNTNLKVKVLSFDKGANKLIFSEKAAGDPDVAEKIANFKIGDKVNGKVTGIVTFGLFIDLGGIEGLIHISEVSWDHVEKLDDLFKVGQSVEALVTSVTNGRISLSIKQMTSDPWESEIKKIKVGDQIEGEVTSITPFGAFVKMPNNLEGLLHVSEFPDAALEGREAIVEGQKHNFTVMSVDVSARKIGLTLKPVEKPKAKKK